MGQNNKTRGGCAAPQLCRRSAVLALSALVLLAVTVTGCSREDIAGGDPTPVSGPVSGQSQQLKVLTSVSTKTAVDGVVLPKGSAIGVMVTDEAGTADFTPTATGNGNADGGYYTDGRNVRFANEAGENIWGSVTTEGKTKLLLFQGEEKGKVFGYYPYTEDANVLGIGNATTIPVKILNEGTIVVSDEPGQGTLNGEDSKLAATAEEEIDFMYNTRNDVVGAKTTTTAKLEMQHALSRVSFRVYTSAEAKNAVENDDESYYTFVGYTIKNKSNGQGEGELHAQFKYSSDTDATRMNIQTGEITGTIAGGEIARTIEGYKMVKSAADDETNNKAAADASYRVSNLLFPLDQITADANNKSANIEVVFQVVRVGSDGTESEPVGYPLPFDVSTVTSWEKGKNYTYTVKFTGNQFSIETVTVTDWNEVAAGDMVIGEDPYVNSAEVSPQGNIPARGATYNIVLRGLLSIYGTDVRAQSGGTALVSGKATVSGRAVSLTVPANTSYSTRTVVFEYKLNGHWVQIGSGRSQGGYSVSVATNAPSSISAEGSTYSVTLTGYLPSAGVEVRALSEGTALVSGKTAVSGRAVSLMVPANTSYSARTVTFQYLWNNNWVDIKTVTLEGARVRDRIGGGFVYHSDASSVWVASLPNPNMSTYYDLLKYCNELTIGNTTGWFIPGLGEMKKISDMVKNNTDKWTSAGGVELVNKVWWTSYQTEDGQRYGVRIGTVTNFTELSNGTDHYYGLCVRQVTP